MPCVPSRADVCTVCGERLFSPYALADSVNEVQNVQSEFRCGMCRRIEPVFARAMAYGSYEGGLRGTDSPAEAYGGVRLGGECSRANVGRSDRGGMEADFPPAGVTVIPCAVAP